MTEIYFVYFFYGLFIAIMGLAWVRPPLERTLAILVGTPLIMLTLGWPSLLATVYSFVFLPPMGIIVGLVVTVGPLVLGIRYFMELDEELRGEKRKKISLTKNPTHVHTAPIPALRLAKRPVFSKRRHPSSKFGFSLFFPTLSHHVDL